MNEKNEIHPMEQRKLRLLETGDENLPAYSIDEITEVIEYVESTFTEYAKATSKDVDALTATNRGTVPTTITHLGLLEYANWWQRVRGRHGQAAVVTHPTIPGTAMGELPFVLEPGRQWMGAMNEDETMREWMGTGRFYVAIYATHSDRPALTPLRGKLEKPKDLKNAKER